MSTTNELRTDALVVGNPIVTDTYTSDPVVLVHEGTVYLYTGHDEAPPGLEQFVMRDWLCFSSTDLLTWHAHGPLLRVDEFAWARDGAKAGTVVEHDGRFFWYVAVNHATIDGGAIGVAVADSPTGPFRDVLGSALVTNDVPFDTGDDHTIDPYVITHDERAYLFWGKERCFSARLDDSMTALAGPIREIDLPEFKEGAHVHERDGWFYLSYGYQFPQRVAYARSRSLDGPWTFEGILNEVPGNCATNRPGIVEFRGDWYFFYHNGVLPGGGPHRRSVCVDRLTYDEHGRIEPGAHDDRGPARTGPAGLTEAPMHLDPELAAAVASLPDLHFTDLAGARRRRRAFADQTPRPELGQVLLTAEMVPGTDGQPPVPVLLATPPAAPRPTPAVLMLHGGGFVLGDADMTTAQAVDLCARLGTVVVSVDYRLAPEHPYPAALHDCAAALAWISERASALGVDPGRVAVYGMSAGGGLAAGLTLHVRDRGGPPICFQVLDAPQLDDRLNTPSMRASTDTPMLTRADAEISWRHYLSHRNADIPPYAAPARAKNLSGLPPAYTRSASTTRCATRVWPTPPGCYEQALR